MYFKMNIEHTNIIDKVKKLKITESRGVVMHKR